MTNLNIFCHLDFVICHSRIGLILADESPLAIAFCALRCNPSVSEGPISVGVPRLPVGQGFIEPGRDPSATLRTSSSRPYSTKFVYSRTIEELPRNHVWHPTQGVSAGRSPRAAAWRGAGGGAYVCCTRACRSTSAPSATRESHSPFPHAGAS